MNIHQHSLPSRLRCGAALVALCLAVSTAGAVGTGDLRADQRDRIRTASLKAADDGRPATFGLLVIPVDFADRRLPAGWNSGTSLTPRLTGGAPSLRDYFAVASGDRFGLQVTVAPVVHLPGTRADYADGPPPNGGYPRTREMARLSMETVRDSGLPMRLLDNDGPDGLAGTDDDDGWVDGVLLLHAGDGLENGGAVAPLQFFLAEPVVGDGVAASSYAVASMHSGLGIWAHETGHLLGLEERYDPTLPAEGGESEIHSRGGLGVFSVMAAGAWGSGAGHGCALPDAYSCLQLGWYDEVALPRTPTGAHVLSPTATGREVAKVWTHGRPAGEYFLLEVRDPLLTAPYDAAVPAGSMLVTHVDESVPDGGFLADGLGGLKLRVRVVEADGNEDLRQGLDEGGPADLFPGSTGARSFTPFTVPDSDGWTGPSHVTLTDITALPEGVAFAVSAADGPAVTSTVEVGAGPAVPLHLTVESLGTALSDPVATVSAGIPSYGYFAGGASSVVLVLKETAPGVWEPPTPPAWIADTGRPAGAATRFVVRVEDGPWLSPPQSLTWNWDNNTAAFDFASEWPGEWVTARPDGDQDTRWTRWDLPFGPVLVCTGTAQDTADWPDIRYWPNAHATLTSPAAGAGVTALRVVHGWDAETLPTGEGMDGGSLEWVGPDGATRPAVPVDGWPAQLAATSNMALHGRGGFAGAMELVDDQPLWRIDVVPVPTDMPGPWRLRFAFATNGLYSSQRGWLVASVVPLTGVVPTQALSVAWNGERLEWEVPDSWTGSGEVEILEAGLWRFLATGQPGLETGTGQAELADLPGSARNRHQVRVRGGDGVSWQAGRALVLYPDGGDPASPFLGLPWPNPARGQVRFLLEVPANQRASLRIYDIRGRLLHEESHPSGSHLLTWNGTHPDGSHVAAGVYILRVDGPTGSRTHKVVYLHP